MKSCLWAIAKLMKKQMVSKVLSQALWITADDVYIAETVKSLFIDDGLRQKVTILKLKYHFDFG